MKYTIEIREWEFFIGEGKPKITKIDLVAKSHLSESDLKEAGIKRALDAHMSEDLDLDGITRWEHYARESIGLTWKVGRGAYREDALCWNMAICRNWVDFATFCTIHAYVKQTTKGAQ